MYSPTGTPLAAVTEVPRNREATRNLHPQAIPISTEQQEPKAAMEPLFEYLPQRQKRDLRLPSASRNMLSIIQANEERLAQKAGPRQVLHQPCRCWVCIIQNIFLPWSISKSFWGMMTTLNSKNTASLLFIQQKEAWLARLAAPAAHHLHAPVPWPAHLAHGVCSRDRAVRQGKSHRAVFP